MAIYSILYTALAFTPLILFSLLPFTAASLSGYSAEIEDQTVVTIYDAYPKLENPKAVASKRKEVCYQEIDACFRIDGNFKHHAVLPQKPENINVKMRLNTRVTGLEKEKAEVLDWGNPQTIANSNFQVKKPILIMTHGFLAHVDKPWLVEMMQAALAMDDVNVIRIGWFGGSGTFNYPQAVADTRVVAVEITKLIEAMVKLGADLDSVWLIGHSLGAHVMGFTGKRLPGIGRITGLDPAEPWFEGYHPEARLDPTDAKFVDAIHTDSNSVVMGGFGSKEPVGHVDYYPNGGHDQPGCKIGLGDLTNSENIKQFVVCNHERAIKIMIESMRVKAEGRTCHFKAHRCSSYESYLREECQECGEGCTFIGPEALLTRPNTTDVEVKMYLVTLGKAPYCGENFIHLSVALPTGFKKDRGQIFVKITVGSESIEQEVTATTKDEILPEHELRRLAVNRNDIHVDSIKEIQIRFKHYWSAIDPSTWPIWGKKKIKVHHAYLAALQSDEQTIFDTENKQFCFGGQKEFELADSNNEWTTISRCPGK